MGDRAGFSLLEAVFALAILGLVSVATLATLAADLRAADRAQRGMEAAALAVDRMERLRLLSADELRLLPDSLVRGRFDIPFDAYRWESETRRVPSEPELIELQVRIEWQSGSYTLESRLFRPRQFGALP